MSDFLIKIGKDLSRQQMLSMLIRIAAGSGPGGCAREFSWGSVAILPDRFGSNFVTDDQGLCGWVGDLVARNPCGLLARLRESLYLFTKNTDSPCLHLTDEPAFRELNGAFAIVLADDQGCWVITDPMSFVQVYETRSPTGQLLGIGTHADTVAAACRQAEKADLCSVAEFLNVGRPSFPHTLHESTKEIGPGCAHWFGMRAPMPSCRTLRYWSPPPEQAVGTTLEDQAAILRHALTQAVRDRCTPDHMGVFLSGGLDSRILLNLIPREINCLALTFSNSPNRETRIAQRVAASLGREWQLLLRSPESLAECLPDAVRILGCEYEWVHAQVIALRSQLLPLSLQSILLGTQFNVYLKGYWASDWQRRRRGAGFLKPAFESRPLNYLDTIEPEWRGVFRPEIEEQLLIRRRALVESRQNSGRGSLAEWLEVYPFSQERGNGFWLAERRLLPSRYVGMDRRVLDFAFRCPVSYKLGNRVFDAAVAPLYGPSAKVAAAMDGVRPLSGHVSRLAQRAARKVQRSCNTALSKVGLRKNVQHSWHDYERYWRESRELSKLVPAGVAILREAGLPVLTNDIGALLNSSKLTWRQGFRLLQLASWKNLN